MRIEECQPPGAKLTYSIFWQNVFRFINLGKIVSQLNLFLVNWSFNSSFFVFIFSSICKKFSAKSLKVTLHNKWTWEFVMCVYVTTLDWNVNEYVRLKLTLLLNRRCEYERNWMIKCYLVLTPSGLFHTCIFSYDFSLPMFSPEALFPAGFLPAKPFPLIHGA